MKLLYRVLKGLSQILFSSRQGEFHICHNYHIAVYENIHTKLMSVQSSQELKDPISQDNCRSASVYVQRTFMHFQEARDYLVFTENLITLFPS